MMSASRPNLRVRRALEAIIRLAGPGLDLLLTVGDRVSRVLDCRDQGYAIVRMDHDGGSAPRALAGYRRGRETA
jgi:hypothetical protein